jgi:hypothetical protein
MLREALSIGRAGTAETSVVAVRKATRAWKRILVLAWGWFFGFSWGGGRVVSFEGVRKG